jgi:hypothetical protein
VGRPQPCPDRWLLFSLLFVPASPAAGGNVWASLDGVHKLLNNATAVRAADKASNRLFLMSLAGYMPQSQLKYAALLRYFPIDPNVTHAECVKAMGWAPTADFCPLHLMDAVRARRGSVGWCGVGGWGLGVGGWGLG